MRTFCKHFILFLLGGLTYFIIEILWRGHSHWAMLLLGGILFIEVGLVNELLPWNMSLALQGCIGGALITLSELAAGLLLNVGLGMDIWDYSNLPFQFMGQICLYYSIGWCFLSILIVIADDYLRWFLFREERPRYRLFGCLILL